MSITIIYHICVVYLLVHCHRLPVMGQVTEPFVCYFCQRVKSVIIINRFITTTRFNVLVSVASVASDHTLYFCMKKLWCDWQLTFFHSKQLQTHFSMNSSATEPHILLAFRQSYLSQMIDISS